jgi:hypothetical protein
MAKPGTIAVSDVGCRYIRYADGSEELYDIAADPYEWNNLASPGKLATEPVRAMLERMRKKAPTEFAARVAPSVESLTKLQWQPASVKPVPASRPDGNPFDVHFINQRDETIELFWMDRNSIPKSYGKIAAGETKRQRTRPGAVWKLCDQNGETLGHFEVGDRTARAIIPASSN